MAFIKSSELFNRWWQEKLQWVHNRTVANQERSRLNLWTKVGQIFIIAMEKNRILTILISGEYQHEVMRPSFKSKMASIPLHVYIWRQRLFSKQSLLFHTDPVYNYLCKIQGTGDIATTTIMIFSHFLDWTSHWCPANLWSTTYLVWRILLGKLSPCWCVFGDKLRSILINATTQNLWWKSWLKCWFFQSND